MDRDKKTLRDRILEEMSVDYESTLEKNFDLAKKYIKITSNGRVDVSVKNKVPGQDKVALYLIGKLYAKEAGKAETELVDNQELAEEIGAPMGSIYPWIKRLKDNNIIVSEKEDKKTVYSIKLNHVEKILNRIDDELDKGV